MTNEPIRSSHRPPGETTGTPDRPAQQLAAPVMPFNLAAEVAALRSESAWTDGERNAKTLVKQPDFRVVLTVMKAGTRLAYHEAAARLTVHVLSGRLRMQLLGTTEELGHGHLLALDRDVRHDVEALEESAFLLTLAWPAGGAQSA
jgi:quercetin dioxygenase-like cupin family protein